MEKENIKKKESKEEKNKRLVEKFEKNKKKYLISPPVSYGDYQETFRQTWQVVSKMDQKYVLQTVHVFLV